MTEAAILRSEEDDAGEDLARSILDRFGRNRPDALIVFSSPVHPAEPLLQTLTEACQPAVLVGCSSAGEFTSDGPLTSSVVAMAIRSNDLHFKVHVARDVGEDVRASATQFAAGFNQREEANFPHRAVMLLMDVLAGYAEEFLSTFTEATSGKYEIFGGGAADDAAFTETHVFAGREAIADGAVGLEIRSRKPIGIGVSHGWTPFSHEMRVTASSGLRIVQLDGQPAADVIEKFAGSRSIPFDRAAPLPFFLNHVLGIEIPDGYKLRVPLRVETDGSIVCAAEIPAGSMVRVMRTRETSAAEAAKAASRRAWLHLRKEHVEPSAALFFDCAATRLRVGDGFGTSVDEVVEALGVGDCVGCNTYGQFARVKGQFSGFHNCTAVVCAFPK